MKHKCIPLIHNPRTPKVGVEIYEPDLAWLKKRYNPDDDVAEVLAAEILAIKIERKRMQKLFKELEKKGITIDVNQNNSMFIVHFPNLDKKGKE